MKFLQAAFLLSIFTTASFAQSFKEDTKAYQEKYKQEFLSDDNSPIKKAEDVQFISFYEPDETYRVTAAFHKMENARPFEMSTISGGTKKYIKYGSLIFSIDNVQYKLSVYQNLSLMENPNYMDLLFLPFTDLSNGSSTYINGRYLDFHKGDIINNQVVLDFNKAYNPYCAFSSGYSCPKPPAENNLNVEIKAGEKKYGKDQH